MKITYYNSAEYKNTTTEEVSVILGNYEPDEMDSEIRAQLRSGEMTPMCNYATADNTWKSIPWNFVIEIDEEE